jgi:hypothetical protein
LAHRAESEKKEHLALLNGMLVFEVKGHLLTHTESSGAKRAICASFVFPTLLFPINLISMATGEKAARVIGSTK